MYRILIVDDEATITDSLVNLVQTSLDQVDVYPAYSARQALSYVQRAGFDILVTDIQMPGMNGIELLERVNQILPQCRTLFLSGHDDFDYAYQAMRHHARRYILKNEKDNVLLDAIRECIADIEQEARQNEAVIHAQELMAQCRPYLKRDYLEKLTHESMLCTEASSAMFAQYEIALDLSRPVLLLAGRLDEPANPETPMAVDMVIRNCLQPGLSCECCSARSSFMLWMIQTTSPHEPLQAVMRVRAAAERMQRTCLQTLRASVSFLLNTSLVEWTELRSKTDEMYHVMGYVLEKREKMAFVYLDYFDREIRHFSAAPDLRKARMQELTEEWQTSLQSAEPAAFENCCHRLQAFASTLHENPSRDELLFFHNLHTSLIQSVQRYGLADRLEDEKLFELMLRNPFSGTSAQVVRRMIYLAHKICQIRETHRRTRDDILVQNVNEYIAGHLHEDLSLVALSEKVYLNPSYLSRRYKEVAGQNVSDVITQMRLARAMELLREDKWKVSAIAEQVGYLSATHFIRVFKKATGLTPQEWRSRQ